MRYQGEADGGAAPGGQERSPGRPGLSWPRANDSDQPGRSGAAWYSDYSDAGQPEAGTAGTGHDGNWPGTPGTGRRPAGTWPAGTDSGTSGTGHTSSLYSDGGYSDAGYGYGDGGYGDGQEPAAEPGAGVAADLMTADVAAGGPASAGVIAEGATGAGASPAAGGMAADRVLATSGAEPGSVPPGSALYGAAGGTAGKGPVRGYPPAPGQSAPVYPPGQFSAWNQAPAGTRDGRAVTEAWPGAASAEHGYGEPGYSVLAVSDPAADATSTQTWAVADDHPAGSWRDMHPGAGQTTDTERVPATSRPAGPAKTKPLPGRPAASAPDGPPERGARGAARSRRGRKAARARRVRVMLGAGLAVVVAAGTGTYFYLAGGQRQAGPPAAAAPEAAPAATQPDQPSVSPTPTGRWGHIQTRLTDRQKLTLHQLYPVRFSSAGSAYARTAAKAGRHCTSAVIGSRLQSAVSAAGCSQLMRASYLAGNRKLMGTIGVLNLRSARLASHAGKATGPSQFIAQLRGAKGPTRRLNKGTGIEEAEVKGHYLILIWAEFASLHAPKQKAQKAELVQFCNRLLKKTANVSLSRRLVTGKP
jgi:hypothetical protein